MDNELIYNDFSCIEHVLRYIVHDINYPFDKIIFDFNNIKSNENNNSNNEKYKGFEDIKAMLLDLLRGGKYSTWKDYDFIKCLKNNNIHHRDEYNEYIKYRKELELPENPFKCFPDFYWEQSYDDNNNPYYSKKECQEKIKELEDMNKFNLDDEEEPETYLHSLDPKIPPICFSKFYG